MFIYSSPKDYAMIVSDLVHVDGIFTFETTYVAYRKFKYVINKL